MVKDKRYELVRKAILAGHIKYFREIFDYIPPTVVARDAHIHYSRLKFLSENVGKISLQRLEKIAELIGVELKKVWDLAIEQIKLSRKVKQS